MVLLVTLRGIPALLLVEESQLCQGTTYHVDKRRPPRPHLCLAEFHSRKPSHSRHQHGERSNAAVTMPLTPGDQCEALITGKKIAECKASIIHHEQWPKHTLDFPLPMQSMDHPRNCLHMTNVEKVESKNGVRAL